MKITRIIATAVAVGLIPLTIQATSTTNSTSAGEGHPPPRSDSMKLVSRLRLTDSPNTISDVTYHRGFAYLGNSEHACPDAGIAVVDLTEPSRPKKVATIPNGPNDYTGEGLQVLSIDNDFFRGDVLLTSNEACDSRKRHDGGISLYDVTDPTDPAILADGVGDRVSEDGQTRSGPPNETHSVIGWTVGDKAYAILQDEEEDLDVDILDISDPTNPKLISETGLPEWPALSSQRARGGDAFHHDTQVKEIDGHFYLLVSYWDAGWVLLDVDDPTNPVFVDDSDYPRPDPLAGVDPPEGNAHQATWSNDNRYILGTDEDFDATRLQGTIKTGDNGGSTFSLGRGFNAPQVRPGEPVEGSTRFVGQACAASTGQPIPPAGDDTTWIAVVERGGCRFSEKAESARAAGYDAVLVVNGTGPGRCSTAGSIMVAGGLPTMLVGRGDGYKILGVKGYDEAACLSGSTSPALPAVGTTGADVKLEEVFDGWGYVHLLDATNLSEIDSYAIPEALDPEFAGGAAGQLTVHEIKTDSREGINLAYASWYDGGARVLSFGPEGLDEVGSFIAKHGNKFWGVFPVQRGDRPPLLLFSDEHFGLYVLKYTGE
jgi:hypothetical protein